MIADHIIADQYRSQSNAALRLERFTFRQSKLQSALKRTIDCCAVVVLLPLVLPILALASAAIVLEDGGPIFFVQPRVGRFGRIFTIFKLRTMSVRACGNEPSPTGKNDPRVTKVGAYLRKLSIDELPQLFNVLRGEMSLVGPRPELVFRIAGYSARWQQLKFIVTPGITGLWQVEARKSIQNHEPAATKLDLLHAERATTIEDLVILVRTLFAMFNPNEVY